jgi:hypothetical protein
MAQGLDTGLSPIRPGFDSRLKHQVFFKSPSCFGGDVKLTVPGTYLVVSKNNLYWLAWKKARTR